MPFAYFNAGGDLVGLDIEMAHTLARDLGVGLALLPVARDQMAELVNSGYCDLIMSGVVVTPERAMTMGFSAPYMDQTLAFVVKDHRREEFSSRDAVRHLKNLRLGVPNIPYYIDKVHRYLPDAALVRIESVAAFFEHQGDELDALVLTAESGSAWSLRYPAYTVTIPQPDVLVAPMAYPVARGNQELALFLNLWLELKNIVITITALYDYWVLGKDAVPKAPRWSVVRNVLHWRK